MKELKLRSTNRFNRRKRRDYFIGDEKPGHPIW